MGAAVEPEMGDLRPVCPRSLSVSALTQMLTRPERQQFLSHGWSRLGRGLGT